MRILFVCLGNICRSPTAAAVMNDLVRKEGLEDEIEIDSAGTGDWHAGQPADRRAQAELKRRGVDLEHTARQVKHWDFDEFDLIIAMDRDNYDDLRELAPTREAEKKVHLLRSFDPKADDDEVPDPWYGGADEFGDVFDMIDAACHGLLDYVKTEWL